MTVKNLREMLQQIEAAGCGDFEIKFQCHPVKTTNAAGTGAIVLPSRTFEFTDPNYEFEHTKYALVGGHDNTVTNYTDNIDIIEINRQVIFHQDQR